jgi:hypothetical protein
MVSPGAWPPLPKESGVTMLAGFDQIAAGDGERLAVAFFIAGEEDRYVRAVESAGGVEGLQRGQDNRQAAFHIFGAGGEGDVAFAFEFLEGAGGFEDGIHVADEEDSFAAGAVAGAFEMACAVDLLHGDEAADEAEFFEAGAEEVGDLAHAGGVESAAVDVDHLFQEAEGIFGVGVDGVNDFLLLGGEGLGGKGEGAEEGEKAHCFSLLSWEGSAPKFCE